MKKSAFNIIIDALSMVVFTAMISTGLLLNYVLPPGSGRIEMLHRGGRGAEKTIDTLCGLTRHEWGEIHLVIALIFLALLLFHLFMHWPWIKAVTFGAKNFPQSLKRKVITVVGIVIVLLILAFPWIQRKKTYSRSEFLQIRELSTQY